MIRENPNKTNETKNYIRILSFIVGIFSVLLLYIDKGPIIPPFSKKINSIDCRYLHFKSINDGSGKIDLNFETPPSLEFPPDYLPHFISIEIQAGPVNITYSGDFFQNVTRDSVSLNFSIVHSFAGQSNITSKCLGGNPHTLHANLSDIKFHHKQHSTSNNPGTDISKLTNVCIENGKFLYFTDVIGNHSGIQFNGELLKFQMLNLEINSYLSNKKVDLIPETHFLVANPSRAAWEQILFTFIPLAKSYSFNNIPPKDANTVFRQSVSDDVLELITDESPIKLDDIMCFSSLVVTSTRSQITEPKQLINALKTLSEDIKLIPKFDKNYKKKIVISENIYSILYETLQEKFPDVIISQIESVDSVEKIRDEISDAKVLIGDHISSLLHMIWMKPVNSSVIDVSHPDLLCNKWFEEFANNISINYFKNGNEKCRCGEFTCYPKVPQEPMFNLSWIIEKLENIL
ncbi:hypothetical protein GPJ56_010071 [Histomonas meleagridis]|uniref:uncharacterized protein n=1 Tax=Histomonas meleagridis TaxID=135588 RepID=UPI00355ABEC1|nr:hypothetical protein GPJ56_010071 [Histomonas meleagridis]KAH0805857.1 hypothetical protein GO595_001347 [Histomonas meleagridis]